MKEVVLTVDRGAVYKEVAKTSAYTGTKMVGDKEAEERITLTDENIEMLTRFWDECRSEVANSLVGLVKQEGMEADAPDDGGTYRLELLVSSSFDDALLPSMELSLRSFFVQNITSQWFGITDKAEADKAEARGRDLLEDVREKAYYRKKPERPTYDDDEDDEA